MHYVYIIKSTRDGRYYIGSAEDPEKRLKEHNEGQTRSTRHRGPYRLVYKEPLDTKTDAIKREHEIKRFKGNSRFKRLINNASPSSSQA